MEIRIPATTRPSHLRLKHRLLQPAVSVPPRSCHLPLPCLFPRTTLYKYLHPRAGRNLSPAASLVSGRACSLTEQLQQIWLPLVRQGQALVWGPAVPLPSPRPHPGVEGAVGGRNSDLKKSQGCGKRPSSLLRLLPTWRPSKSCLIPAMAGEVGPAPQRNSFPGWGPLQFGLGDHSKANWPGLGQIGSWFTCEHFTVYKYVLYP